MSGRSRMIDDEITVKYEDKHVDLYKNQIETYFYQEKLKIEVKNLIKRRKGL